VIALASAILLAATANASVKNTKVEVGEPVAITVKVAARPNAMVTLRPPPPSVPAYTVETGGSRMLPADGNGIVEFTFHVVPWEHGEVKILAGSVEIAGQGEVPTNPLTLTAVNPLGEKAADAKPKDIRGIRPFPAEPVAWPYFLASLIAGCAAAWFFLRSKKEPPKKAEPAPTPRPVRTDRTLADWIEAVRRIAENPPRDAAAMREAHFTIAEAVRRFVEERWEIPASKQTTEEFLSEIAASSRFRGGGMSILPVVLEACDRVKWAEDRVGPQDTLEVAKLALDFFQASRGALQRGLGAPPVVERAERGAS
jgi:hypothetical protein